VTSGGPPLIECDLPLGQPGLVVHNELSLGGWAASPDGISGVAVDVEGRSWTAGYGLDTPAVAKQFPGVEGAEHAGYRLAIDTSRWEPGPRYIAVAAFDARGRRSAVEGAVEVRPFTVPAPDLPGDRAALERQEVTLTLDSPTVEAGAAKVEGRLAIRGWAYAKQGIEAVLVTLDGTLQQEALRPIARPDLLRDLGPDVAAGAGFSLMIDPVDCPPGSHRLEIAALDRGGHVAGIECELVCLPPAKRGPEVAMGEGGVQATPRLRAEDARSAAGERAWEDRALLAEADAALARAEARLAEAGQERARRELHAAESDPRVATSRLRRELATARRDLTASRMEATERAEREKAERRGRELQALREARHRVEAVQRELSAVRYELEATKAELSASHVELAQRAALLNSVERSLSWRATRPLRAMKRFLGRGATTDPSGTAEKDR
jgi:hypothetical protein